MSTPRGEFNRRVQFQRPTTVQGGLGTDQPSSWSPLGGAWAKVLFGSGQERRQAAADGATMTATFRVLSTAKTRDVTEQDRIWFDGRAWDIASIAPVGVNDEIDFAAVVAKG